MEFSLINASMFLFLMMEFAGYFSSLLIGISLGLIGGGGSVLTVPILAYLFSLDAILATAYSLFIVGCTSAVAALQKWKNQEINFHVAFTFGIPSLLTVYFMRKYFIPLVPDIIYQSANLTIYKGSLTLVMFSLLMMGAAAGMLKPQQITRPVLPKNPALIGLGILIGLLSGLLGAGGGFIIIPALVFYASLDMKTAVGTSLLIISLNSLIGFTGDLSNHYIDWNILIPISLLAMAGTFIGHKLSTFIPSGGIKKIFGVFILIIGLLIFVKELFI